MILGGISMITILAKIFIKNRPAKEQRQAYGTLCSIVGICLNVCLFAGKYDDFGLPANTEISTSPFVFRGGEQWKEWNEERPMLKKLMNELKIKPYFIYETNSGYEVSEF